LSTIALSDEVRNVQNPALGAALLWRFVCGYTRTQKEAGHVPLQLVFVVLPIIFHEETCSFLKSTQEASGMRAFAAKFGEYKNSKQDLLLAIHGRTEIYKALTLDSLRIAIRAHLVRVRPNGMVMPLSTAETKSVTDHTKPLLVQAEKLGAWCGHISPHEVATILKLRF
jgi:hypothetical protein